MLPNASSGKRLAPRQVFVVSHGRSVESPDDPDDAPIVAPMTRKRLGKMSPANAQAWKKQSMDAIMAATEINERETIEKYMNKKPKDKGSASTTPSTANNTAKAKVKTTAKDKVATPEGLTPSQRDGAPGRAILCYSPWVWSSPA